MRKIQRHSRFEMFSHIETYKSSRQSQKTYCKRKGIALSTFQYWAKKYREEFSKDETLEDTTFIAHPTKEIIANFSKHLTKPWIKY